MKGYTYWTILMRVVLSMLDNNSKKVFFNSRDVNFFVTGNGSLDNKVISMINNNELNTTTIIIWVEPFLYGGHCLILNDRINKNLLRGANNKFKYRVIENGELFLKDDVGCSGRYVQYSGFDSKKFIYDLVYYLKNDFNKIKMTIG